MFCSFKEGRKLILVTYTINTTFFPKFSLSKMKGKMIKINLKLSNLKSRVSRKSRLTNSNTRNNKTNSPKTRTTILIFNLSIIVKISIEK